MEKPNKVTDEAHRKILECIARNPQQPGPALSKLAVTDREVLEAVFIAGCLHYCESLKRAAGAGLDKEN